MNDRKGAFCQTFGGKFWPADPRVDEIHLETIAHAEALLCRWGGHCRSFYTVAQHSVLCTQQARPEHRLAALMHDASESYLVDIPRPVKEMCPDYRRLEEGVEQKIAEKFGFDYPMPPEVKEIDDRMLITEARQLLNRKTGEWWLHPKYRQDPFPIYIVPWGPRKATEMFLRTFYAITHNQPLPQGKDVVVQEADPLAFLAGLVSSENPAMAAAASLLLERLAV